MSFNQSRGEKSEAHYRKSNNRSGNSGNQRNFSGSGAGGKGGGGNAPPTPQSSSFVNSGNRSVKKPSNGQGGQQSRVTTPNSHSQLNTPAAARPAQNGAHVQVQPPSSVASDAPASGVGAKPTDPSAPRTTRPVPKAPTPFSQPTTEVSDSVAPSTPAKADIPKSFQLQFGSISPGVVNGMQIPARTSSAPPNLDEQKRDQAHHVSFRAAPTMPIPSKQPLPVKDAGSHKQSIIAEPHTASNQTKRDAHPHPQVPSAPGITVTQKPSLLPIPGISMPMQYQQQVPMPFGGPNSQIQSQSITSTPQQMPIPLSVGPAGGHKLFVPGLQSHTIPTQGMIPQGQSLNFATQIGHQMPPQMANFGLGIPPQFSPQPAGKFVTPRKAVKITHPDTHEELRLDKRTDSYIDSGSSGPRSHPNVVPQSQPLPSINHHQINYYPPMQPSTYNPTSIYYPTPQTSTQMTTGPQAARYNYPVGQGSSPAISLKNPSTLNPLPAAKNGPPVITAAESLIVEHPAQVVTSSVPLPTVQVTVKPAVVSLGEKVGTSSVTISSPVVRKSESPPVQVTVKPAVVSLGEKVGTSSVTISSPAVRKSESPKLLRETKDSGTFQPQRESDVSSGNSSQQSKSVLEPAASIPSLVTGKHSTASTTGSVQKIPTSTPSSASTSPSKDAEGREKESIRRVDSFKDHQKKVDTYNPEGISKSSLPRMPSDVTRGSDVMQSSPAEVVESSPTIVSCPSQDLKRSDSLKDGNSAEVLTSGESLPDAFVSSDASKSVASGLHHGDGDISSVSLNKSDIQSERNISDNLDVSQLTNQDLVEVQLEQECIGIVEGKYESFEDTKRGGTDSEKPTESTSESSDNQVGMNSDYKANVESVDRCSSEVERTNDNLKRLASTSDPIDAETASFSSVSCESSHEDKTSNIGVPACSTDRDFLICSTSAHQDPHSDSTTISSDVTSKHEAKSTETSSGGLGPVSSSKDKPTSELTRVKSISYKAKKKRKDILKAADAAGSTSDLYMAYKGPEEKQENAVASENLDSSSSVDVMQVPADGTEKVVITADEDGQTKAEPDDWEDAADMSTPKLKTSGVENQGRNEDGKTGKRYSRDFLLTLSEQCTDLPAGFAIGSDIADALMHPNTGRNVDRASGGPRPDRRGGMQDDDKWNKSPGPYNSVRDQRMDSPGGFRPNQGNHGVSRNLRGPVGVQHAGGILTGPMQSAGSQGMQRSNSDADRWQRNKGLIPSPQTPLQVMHKAEKKYEIHKVSDIEVAKQRQLKAILNKLTPQNFEKLFEQVKDVNIDNDVTLTGVISQIFDKALTEPTFCEMYANFCSHLAAELPDFSKDNEKITFKRLLLNKCQEEFERGEIEQAEANKVEEEGEVKCSVEEKEEKRIQARRRMLGNIRLIGELYKKKMLTERIMHACIKKLLGQHQNPDEEDIEALCKLMSTIGEMIDHPKSKVHMDAYFNILTQFSNNMKLSSRVRFMLKDSIDLRKNRWQQRRKVDGPKKIDEVHRDAAQERHAQATRLARGPNIGSSSRRGQPLDFGPRGSAVLSSPNSQMGGLRGYPPQVRGYGQDVRMEERHSYESRTLSVPLSQRPLDDNSITLGPQGGLARGMSVRGQPLMSGVPVVDIPPPVDPRRFAASPNGYSSPSEWSPSPYAREETLPRLAPERSMAMPAYDQSNSQEHNSYIGNRDLRIADHSSDRSMASSVTNVHEISSPSPAQVAPDKVWSEERLRDMSISTIREFYSAKDKEEVALCIRELNSPSFYPSMVSIWVTDSFERKDMERDLLAKLLVDLTKPRDSLLNQVQLVKGFESVLATLEDSVSDAPRAAEYLGRILAKVIIENVVPLRDVGRIIHEGGDEPGRLQQIGLASEVLSSILETIRSEKGESVFNEIRSSSSLRIDDFRPPDPIKSRKLEAFF